MEDEVFYTPGNMPNFDALRPSKRTEIKHQVKEAQKQRKKRSRLMRRLAKKAKKEGVHLETPDEFPPKSHGGAAEPKSRGAANGRSAPPETTPPTSAAPETPTPETTPATEPRRRRNLAKILTGR